MKIFIKAKNKFDIFNLSDLGEFIEKAPNYFFFIIIFGFVFYFYKGALGLFFLADDWATIAAMDWSKVIIDHPPYYFEDFKPIPLLFFQLLKILNAKPLFYHLINLILHSINGCLLYVIFVKIFDNKLFSFLGVILWLVLPTHSESLYWINGQFMLWFGMFTLIFIICILNNKILGALFAMIGAILSKEFGFALCLPMPWIFGKKGWYFILVAGVLAVFRSFMVGGIGLYGIDHILRSINPINTLKIIGYICKCLLPF